MRRKRIMNRIYNLVGKTVVFVGAFLGFFFLIGGIVTFLEPFVLKMTTFCMDNIDWILIGVFLISSGVWGFTIFLDNKSERIKDDTFED